MDRFWMGFFGFVLSMTLVAGARVGVSVAEDIDGVREHPMVHRYPGQDIRWQQIENYLPFRIPVGPVTGYRGIDEWIHTEGRVTRTFYRYQGADRTYAEIYKNYLDAFTAEGFEILAQGLSDDRKGVAVGSRKWFGIYLSENPAGKPGEVGTVAAGTSSQGGAGAFIARKERAAGTAYVVVYVEQHAADYVGALIDIVEVAAAQTGLVVVDAEAIGRDMDEKGRVVLDGLFFDFDKATLTPDSKQALEAIASYVNANARKRFYVVGHTDGVGKLDYNTTLSANRARSVVDALSTTHGVAAGRLEPHGVGPLVPVFSNATDPGRDKNRRVELVERLE